MSIITWKEEKKEGVREEGRKNRKGERKITDTHKSYEEI